MILTTAKLIKALALLVALGGSYFLLRRKMTKKALAGFGMLTVLFALIANALSGLVPTLTDELTLTAQGKKNEDSLGYEIIVDGFWIDGKHYCVDKIKEGKWFWRDDQYIWRIETDNRQPEGTTRTVILEVPSGWSREILFSKNEYCGIVEMTTAEGTETIDTSVTPSAVIGRSNTAVLIWSQIRRLAVYAAALLFLWGLSVSVLIKAKKEPAWIKANGGKLLYGVISAAAFVLMVHYANTRSLWYDELARIYYCMQPLPDIIRNLLQMKDMSPPLFSLAAHFWYQIAPYGERWLLLISIIPIAVSAFIMGLCGETLQGKCGGILAAVLMALSPTVWGYAAFEFSGYAFTIFFMSLCLYCHIRRNVSQNKKRWMIAYSLALAGLAMSHYFGMIACGIFFMTDAVLALKSRISWKAVWSYVLPGTLSAVWLAMVWNVTFRTSSSADIANWYGVPSLGSVRDMLNFLAGGIPVLFYILLFGIGLSLVLCFQRTGGGASWKIVYCRLSGIAIAGMLAGFYIYGNYINTRSTLWEGRYFLFLTVFADYLIVYSIFAIAQFLKDNNVYQLVAFRRRILTAVVSVAVGFTCVRTGPTSGPNEPYREAESWLYSQNDVFKDDTLIIETMKYTGGLKEYYVERQGKRDPLNLLYQGEVTEEMLQGYQKVYLQYSHTDVLKELQEILDKEFSLEDEIPSVKIKVFTK